MDVVPAEYSESRLAEKSEVVRSPSKEETSYRVG